MSPLRSAGSNTLAYPAKRTAPPLVFSMSLFTFFGRFAGRYDPNALSSAQRQSGQAKSHRQPQQQHRQAAANQPADHRRTGRPLRVAPRLQKLAPFARSEERRGGKERVST